MRSKDVIYNKQILKLARFWGDHRLCLWAKEPSQTEMQKMEFVGGHPDEWCIFVDNLTEDEIRQITDTDGNGIDVFHALD